ncbi:outer membrane protein [Algoriella xinjiangensis]|uniref:Outer membrane protein n=1 Tax=Algoriella xinjiangensis TaxID=684065 RepID=A0A1I4VBZ2_9FLAO|nr:OmpW family outer membrane protein [Algoriella xinjiangensis]SFM98699.1 outer membrane protein [Algoriella xinjiangensis]VDH17091.1 Outer membrane protein W precursor [Algoriella xinjiangensis]
MKKGLLVLSGLLLSTLSFGQEAGELHMRVRATGVVPMEDAKIETIGGNVAVSNNLIPEVDFTYYFTKNIAAELILGTSKHEVVAVNTALGNLDLGRVMLLPPTLNLQYHFYPTKNLKPYVGAGLNYTIFYDQGQGKGRNAAVTSVAYDNNLGYSFQLGFDYKINDKLYWNVDVKKLYLNTDVEVGAALPSGQVYVPAEVDLNPWLISTGIGFKLF